MAITENIQHILGGGIKTWGIKATNAANASDVDDAYYFLLYPYDGKFIEKTLSQVDSYAKETAHAIDIGYEAKFMVTNKTNLIKMIPTIMMNPTDHILIFQNGRVMSSANLHDQKFGTNFKLVFDSDMENVRYLQFTATRKIMVQPITLVGTVNTTLPSTLTGTGTNFTTALRAGDIVQVVGESNLTITSITNDTTAVVSGIANEVTGAAASINDWLNLMGSAPANGTANASDILYNLNSLTRSSVFPGGVKQVQVREQSSGSWTHTFGKVNKFKLTIEGLGEMDQEGRMQTNRAKFSLDMNMMQSQVGYELTDIQTLAQQENEFLIEFVDGMFLNLLNPSNIGLDFELHNDTDANGNQFINVKGGGVVKLSSTTFADMWA